jgi:VanZ family protein
MPLISFLVDPQYRIARFRTAIALYVSVLVLGSIPGARAEMAEVASGLALHFATYACITFLLFTGFDGAAAGRALKAIVLIAAMGAVDEFVQSFFPYRHASVGDWYVDISAGMFMVALLCVWTPRRRKTPG